MITLQANGLSDAWQKAIIALYRKPSITSGKLIRDDILVLEIENPFTKKHDELFPMSANVMKEYTEYIINGGERGNVHAEHALYFSRIAQFPESKASESENQSKDQRKEQVRKEHNCNNQLHYVIEALRKKPNTKRAIMSLWHPDTDQSGEKVPCMLYFWFRIENEKLVMHVHMRANDAYKKLLMNLNICVKIQEHIAEKVNVGVGKYVHIVDSFHLYAEDEENIKALYQKIQ